MKTEKVKKVLSLLLVLCLFISLVPVIPAVATEDDAPVNLIANGSLEDGTQGWELYYSFTNTGYGYAKVVTGDSANAYNGDNYLQLAPSGGNNFAGARTSVFAVTPGEQIVLKYRTMGSTAAVYELRGVRSATQHELYNSYDSLQTDCKKFDTWTEVEHIVTIPEGCTQYAFGFVVMRQNYWGSDDVCLRFDDVRVYRVDADYVNYEINQAIDAEDAALLGEWLGHTASGLENVMEENVTKYLSALVSAKAGKGKNLSTAEIQTIIDGMNDGTLYIVTNLVSNGSFEKTTNGVPDGWIFYNTWSANPWPQVITDSEVACAGNNYIQTAPAGSYHSVGIGTTFFAVEPGATLLIKYWVKGSPWISYQLRGSQDTSATQGTYTVLTDNNTASSNWEEKSHLITVPEGATSYALSFYFDKVNAWGSNGYTLDFDDVRVYKVDAGYVNYEINRAIDGEDATALGEWMQHVDSGLNNVTEANTAKYLNALITVKGEKGRDLSASEIQRVIDGINDNTLYVMANLVSNGSFEKTTNGVPNGWIFYNSWSGNSWPKVITDDQTAYTGSNYLQTAPAGQSNSVGAGTAFFNVEPGATLLVKYRVKGNPAIPYQLRGSSDAAATQNNYTVLADNNTASSNWEEKSHLITVPEGAASYALSFYFDKINAWGSTGYTLDFDEVRVYVVDADYVAHEINVALTAEDLIAFKSWITHELSELIGYDRVYAKDYYHALLAEQKEKERDLTHSEIQAVINAVNTTRTTGAGTEEITADVTGAGIGSSSNKIHAVPGETYYVEAKVSGKASGVQMYFEQWDSEATTKPGKQTITTHTVSTAESRIYSAFTMNIGYEYFTVSFGKVEGETGDVSLSDVQVYKVNQALALRNMNIGIEEQDKEFFYAWAVHNASSVTQIKEYNLDLYMEALAGKKEDKGEALTYKEIQTIIDDINWRNKPYKAENIGTQLELFVEDSLIDLDDTTASLVQKLPEEKEIAIKHNEAWEGYTSVYHTIFKDGDIYRMYYRGVDDDSRYNTICYAYSYDGVNWIKPKLGICEFNGSTDNNIIFDYNENNTAEYAQRVIECFFAFKDTNPNTTEDARYKGLLTVRGNWSTPAKEGDGNIAYAFKSTDGIHWEVMNDGKAVFDGRSGHGSLDSHNVAYWNEARQQYVMFFRENLEGGADGYVGGILRTTSTLTSQDFLVWDKIENATGLEYDFEKLVSEDDGYYGSMTGNYQVYVNGITIYDRAPQLYIGTPTRYLNDAHEVAPYLIASRDGVNFKWWNEMLIKPEGNRAGNRSNYAMWGISRTSDTEYSMYASEGWSRNYSDIRRFTFRVDGFVAAHGDESGEQILLTKPIIFAGDHLILNYATGNSGSVAARLLDTSGNVIEGFDYTDCTALTGDSIGEELKWTRDLSALIGKEVKIQFKLTNADIYSYQFAEGIPGAFKKISSDRITDTEATRLNWETSDYALSYKITLAEDAGFTTGVKEYTSLASFVDVTGLDSAKEYYWKVEAVGAEGSTFVTDVKLLGYTVTLGGRIGVNFFMNLNEGVTTDANAVMRFTQKGNTVDIPVADAELTANGYKFTCEIAAKEMTDSITAQMFSGDTAISEAYTYSVKEYADTIIANEGAGYTDKAVALAKSMINYGAYAQIYFNYNTNKLANSSLESSDKVVSAVTKETLASYKNSDTQSNAAIAALAGSSLVLESETTMKLYFSLANGINISDLTFSIGDMRTAAVKSGNYYYVAIENIAAHNLNKDQEVTVTNGNDTLTARYNVMTYGYNVLSRATTDRRTEALKDVVRAMWLYNQAAEAYLEGGQ